MGYHRKVMEVMKGGKMSDGTVMMITERVFFSLPVRLSSFPRGLRLGIPISAFDVRIGLSPLGFMTRSLCLSYSMKKLKRHRPQSIVIVIIQPCLY
jgi:hypothetical protein